MGLIDNIKECVGGENICLPSFRAVMFGDYSIFIENVKGIIFYQPEQISLSLKKGGLKISGKELFIKQYCGGDVIICGKISAVERV